MTIINIAQLHEQIAAVCPIDGVNSDKIIHFRPEATEAQRAAAYKVLEAFNDDRESINELARWTRAKRNSLLSMTDWSQLPDVPTGMAEKYRSYRQALRDVPRQAGFPGQVTWPICP